MKKTLLILTLCCFPAVSHATGSTLYPWPTNWSLGGLASWAQPLLASGTLPAAATANVGEIFLDVSVATAPALYVKIGSAWVLIAGGSGSDPGLATCGQDLSGTVATATVIAIQGVAASSTAPTDGQVLTYDNANTTWKPASPAIATTTVGGDLSGDLPNPTVDGIQGYAASSTAPTAGKILRYTATGWAPTDMISTGTSLPATSTSTIGDLFILGTMPPLIYQLEYSETGGATSANLIPTMTSNILPAGCATASHENGSYLAYKAMDKDPSTYWNPGVPGPAWPVWLGYVSSSAAVVTQYSLTCGDPGDSPYPPASWTFEGSNDGLSYDTLDTVEETTWASGTPNVYVITNTTGYTHYRWQFTQSVIDGSPQATIRIMECSIHDAASSASSVWQQIGLYRSDTAPSSPSVGDHWYDTGGDNKEKVWDGAAWQDLW